MSKILPAIISGILLFSAPVIAETSSDYHPAWDNRFSMDLGVFYPDKTFKLRVDGTVPEEEIDFEETLKLDDDELSAALNFRWRFGEKWALWGQFWSLEDRGAAMLTEDIEWDDVIFKEGTFAGGGMKTSVSRLFFGRTFRSGPGRRFGLGAGLHWLEIEAYLTGQIITHHNETELHRESVSAGFPLPNIGAWFDWSWSSRWMFTARVDTASATVGDYSGGLWNAGAGVNWAIFEHVGIGLHYNFFKLDVDVDNSDWRGKVETAQNGPYLAITATW